MHSTTLLIHLLLAPLALSAAIPLPKSSTSSTTAPAPTYPSTNPPSPPVTWPAGQSYQKVVLAHHNAHRANHSAAPLRWSPSMFDNARTLAQRCVWRHDTSIGGQAYGQNLAAGYRNLDVGRAITGGWYEGEVASFDGQYGQETPDMSDFGSYGHFTQVVWKGSKTVGCITYDCGLKGGLKDAAGNAMPGLDFFTVCNYFPVGNMMGDFAGNVDRSVGRAAYTAVP